MPIWKLALVITKAVYDITSKPVFQRDFALKDQLRRSVISISSNIVEGFEKNNNNEFVRYLRISKGSAGEIRNQLYVALTIFYITEPEFEQINQKLISLGGQIGGLIIYLIKKKQSAIRNPKSKN